MIIESFCNKDKQVEEPFCNKNIDIKFQEKFPKHRAINNQQFDNLYKLLLFLVEKKAGNSACKVLQANKQRSLLLVWKSLEPGAGEARLHCHSVDHSIEDIDRP
eukprot:TRINITY_DN17183_c0_g1_i2.p3 TRINITY_DN17183_c0_g1~~TRINITY_DN17183_c0_g1_i2.p3  ORF type:complete len:104 (-),score=11.53 TRINITY_DN17183_c0_g1_i2:187-498(-)